MAVSNWYLYLGIFLCCSGVLLPVGIFFIVWWFWSRHEDMEKAKSEFIQNNYFVNFSGGYDDRDNSEPWKTTAHPDGTARDYVSKETLEENR
jgi:uncharacterized membrane protein YukC|tara:strand:+ start:757 stop:1032 length:276 start_codon:yes stop_codon:yes gene_type:complete